MITIRMNSDEILRHMKADEARMRMSVISRVRNLPIRPQKKGSQKCDSLAFSKKMDSSNQEYVVVIYTLPKVMSLQWILFSVVRESRGTFYIEMPNESFYALALSHHVLRRYKERMNMPECSSINRVISTYFVRSINKRILYKKDKKLVYAFCDGLLLGDYDESKCIVYLRTFVSKDMLKETQKEAFLLSEEFAEKQPKYYSFGFSNKEYMDYMNKIYKEYDEVYEEAESIYNSFYENDDNDNMK